MVLVHDLVEIYAGDTFAFDDVGHRDKELRERQAADQLFGLLPADQRGSCGSCGMSMKPKRPRKPASLEL